MDVQRKAKEMGIKASRFKKADLIRKIQTKEGNTPCFQVSNESCIQGECCWKNECLH